MAAIALPFYVHLLSPPPPLMLSPLLFQQQTLPPKPKPTNSSHLSLRHLLLSSSFQSQNCNAATLTIVNVPTVTTTGSDPSSGGAVSRFL